MKAVVQETYGPPEVLEVRDIDRPAIGAGEILVEVRASAVDAGVSHLMRGTPYAIRLGSGLRRPKNPVRGMDVAGIVAEVGGDVTGFRPGDEVFGICAGGFAEYAVGRPGKLVAKPANLTFAQAGAIAVSAATALKALCVSPALRAALMPSAGGAAADGEEVLVIGAGGGVGSYAVQLAVAAGARVTGVCSAAKVDRVRGLGAAEVLDYTRDSIPDGRFTLIVDTAGNRPLPVLRRALTPAGTLVIVGGEIGRWKTGAERPMRAALVSPFVGQKLRGVISVPRLADLEALRALAEAGAITPMIDRVYGLDAAAEAVHRFESGDVCGKVVIAP